MNNIPKYMKLYLVLESGMLKMPLDEFIPAVVDGGVTCIQIRDKNCSSRERFDTGRRVMDLLKGKDVMFVVNDRADIAAALGAGAVHVGAKDVPLAELQKAFPSMLYGYSCNNSDDIMTAEAADYIGVGPAFFTDTKADLRGLIGPEGIKALLQKTDKPAVAIGGINAQNIELLRGTGINGVAVSSAICAAADPYEAAKILREKAELL
jgi:thiamine-phosphate pyrophosphorylase